MTRTEIVTITPELAAQWLANNRANNRTITKNNVSRHVAEIKAGRWAATAGLIHLDTAGQLINGQHRLTAVVQAQVSIQQLVCFNTPPEVFDHIDQGKSRNASDVLSTHGYTSTKRLAAIALCCISVERGGALGRTLPAVEILKYIQANTEGILLSVEYPDHISIGGVTARSGGASVRAAIAISSRKIAHRRLREFMQEMSSGAAEKGDVIYALRQATATARVDQQSRYQLAIRMLYGIHLFDSGSGASVIRQDSILAYREKFFSGAI